MFRECDRVTKSTTTILAFHKFLHTVFSRQVVLTKSAIQQQPCGNACVRLGLRSPPHLLGDLAQGTRTTFALLRKGRGA